jgi:hypothetical protein
MATRTREIVHDFASLADWTALADCTPLPRPIALAFFAPAALREFLKSTLEHDADQGDDANAQPAAETETRK